MSVRTLIVAVTSILSLACVPQVQAQSLPLGSILNAIERSQQAAPARAAPNAPEAAGNGRPKGTTATPSRSTGPKLQRYVPAKSGRASRSHDNG
jgi:hypothetical protein